MREGEGRFREKKKKEKKKKWKRAKSSLSPPVLVVPQRCFRPRQRDRRVDPVRNRVDRPGIDTDRTRQRRGAADKLGDDERRRRRPGSDGGAEAGAGGSPQASLLLLHLLLHLLRVRGERARQGGDSRERRFRPGFRRGGRVRAGRERRGGCRGRALAADNVPVFFLTVESSIFREIYLSRENEEDEAKGRKKGGGKKGEEEEKTKNK